MSAYIKLLTLEYPRYQGDIRLEHPEIGNEFVCPNTYALVVDSEPLTFDETIQTVEQSSPVQVDGIWQQTWLLRNLTAEELEARRLIEEQNNRYLTNSGSTPNVIG